MPYHPTVSPGADNIKKYSQNTSMISGPVSNLPILLSTRFLCADSKPLVKLCIYEIMSIAICKLMCMLLPVLCCSTLPCICFVLC